MRCILLVHTRRQRAGLLWRVAIWSHRAHRRRCQWADLRRPGKDLANQDSNPKTVDEEHSFDFVHHFVLNEEVPCELRILKCIIRNLSLCFKTVNQIVDSWHQELFDFVLVVSVRARFFKAPLEECNGVELSAFVDPLGKNSMLDMLGHYNNLLTKCFSF